MSCAISPIAMAHQWRRQVCAITIGALGKTNGAKRAPLGFFQWSANGATALSRGLAGRNSWSRFAAGRRTALIDVARCPLLPGRPNISRNDRWPPFGRFRRDRFANCTMSGRASVCDRRPPHLPVAARLRSRAAFSLATVDAFSNCAMAPSTWRTSTAVSSVKWSGALAGISVTPRRTTRRTSFRLKQGFLHAPGHPSV
jgi:hypothetical protein